MQFQMELTGLPVHIEAQYPYVKHRCRSYIVTDKVPVFSAGITLQEIAQRKAMPDRIAADDDLIEMNLLHIRISDMLASYGACAAHGSCFAMDGRAFLFMAPSGTGKSTHARLWQDRFGSQIEIINDDKPFISVRNGEVRAWGSPWSGKHNLDRNISAPLCGICLLERSETNSIERLKQEDAFCGLLPFFHYPAERDKRTTVIGLVRDISALVPVYRLSCNMDPEAAEVAYSGLCSGLRKGENAE